MKAKPERLPSLTIQFCLIFLFKKIVPNYLYWRGLKVWQAKIEMNKKKCKDEFPNQKVCAREKMINVFWNETCVFSIGKFIYSSQEKKEKRNRLFTFFDAPTLNCDWPTIIASIFCQELQDGNKVCYKILCQTDNIGYSKLSDSFMRHLSMWMPDVTRRSDSIGQNGGDNHKSCCYKRIRVKNRNRPDDVSNKLVSNRLRVCIKPYKRTDRA